MKTYIKVRTAKCLGGFFGFTLQKGAAFGKAYLPHHTGVQDFVCMGKKRRIKRPDGTKAGWEIFIFHKPDIPDWSNEKDLQLWEGEWFPCEKGTFAEFLLNRHIQVEYAPKQPKITGVRNLFAEVKKPQSKGFIYSMVRNAQ